MAVNNSSNLRQIDTDSGSAIVTAAVPNWEVVGGTGISTSASGNTITITNTAGSSSLVQQVRAQSTTAVVSSSSLTLTSTPTTANTTFLISATITPTDASNILVFNFSAPMTTGAGYVGTHLFQGTTLLTSIITGVSEAIRGVTPNLLYYQTAGTTSSTTFNIYFSFGDGGTNVRTLQTTTGTALYGGSVHTSFIITEVAV